MHIYILSTFVSLVLIINQYIIMTFSEEFHFEIVTQYVILYRPIHPCGTEAGLDSMHGQMSETHQVRKVWQFSAILLTLYVFMLCSSPEICY